LSNVDAIDKEKADKLLSFLPALTQPGRAFVTEWRGRDKTGDMITIPYPVYCEDVDQFFEAAADDYWNDTSYDPGEQNTIIDDDAYIVKASFKQLRSLLTYCVRGERFSDGHRESLLRTGRVGLILQRLKHLVEDS
jgi:hypothetical protein